MAFPKINPNDYLYDLPQDKIAESPLSERDASNLLVYRNGKISDAIFKDLNQFLPDNSLLFFNNTKVIPARMHFLRESGARIEILLDKAHFPSKDPLICLNQKKSCAWNAIIGNKKKWKDQELLKLEFKLNSKNYELQARLIDRESNLVEFSWSGDLSFASVLEALGHTPLPPYIQRAEKEEDKESYQTVYAKINGAVAAPTAGLHFTDHVIENLKNSGIKMDELTLHVGAGTFSPIKSDNAAEHNMHSELIQINRRNLLSILNHKGPIIPVGTTAMRSLESLYWFGQALEHKDFDLFECKKELPYELKAEIELKKAMQNIINWMDQKGIEAFSGDTSIFIVPGYKFQVCNGIITNFHQPGTTLILLIAALIGEEWRAAYEHALRNNYRFLSYGDSSLLLP